MTELDKELRQEQRTGNRVDDGKRHNNAVCQRKGGLKEEDRNYEDNEPEDQALGSPDESFAELLFERVLQFSFLQFDMETFTQALECSPSRAAAPLDVSRVPRNVVSQSAQKGDRFHRIQFIDLRQGRVRAIDKHPHPSFPLDVGRRIVTRCTLKRITNRNAHARHLVGHTHRA